MLEHPVRQGSSAQLKLAININHAPEVPKLFSWYKSDEAHSPTKELNLQAPGPLTLKKSLTNTPVSDLFLIAAAAGPLICQAALHPSSSLWLQYL